MSIKISIKTDDARKFQEIARLVDSPDFSSELVSMRRKLKIAKPIRHQDFEQYIKTKIYYYGDPEELAHINHLVDQLEVLRSQSNDLYNETEIDNIEKELAILNNPLKAFYYHVSRIRSLFGLLQEYEPVIAKAIVCGEVHGDDLDLDLKIKQPREAVRDREWYWSNKRTIGKERKGYKKLSQDAISSVSTVSSAIKTYESNLHRVTK
jgi:hypothetical protein